MTVADLPKIMDNALNWDPKLEAYCVNLDVVEDVSIGVAVVRSVAALEDTPATSLEPLQESIDPDALNALCQTGENTTKCRVRFQYQGYSITVVENDEIRLSPSDDIDVSSISIQEDR
ncbi:HalOD1 output domain-containing protein [Halomicrobium urmianum]|uniref:HalOD1 output domain-containing protein n=1 Tax=Halomicrobium urmianum TaxID=1586233 RepID=UPI001CDA33D7|nr:HalOD1 output domain-containing protein [Halomicrobium urmianum]